MLKRKNERSQLEETRGKDKEDINEPPTSTSMEKLDELFGAHIKQCIKINPTERELLERPLLRLDSWSCCFIDICLQKEKS